MTIQQTCVISNNHNKSAATSRNLAASITLLFEEALAKFSSVFLSKKSTSKAIEKLYLNDKSGIIESYKSRAKKSTSGNAKTIEEFDLAGCFDKSEIIAAKVDRLRYLWPYHDNPTKEESRYDREQEDQENLFPLYIFLIILYFKVQIH